jgi:predicted ATP-dependent endonuclease of OLD family
MLLLQLQLAQFLGVRSPEAHLHPQLQIRLLKYLRNIKNVQIIITTHSTVLASSASLNSLIHLSKHTSKKGIYEYKAVSLKLCKLKDNSQKFIERWLDVTKSNLLFAKGVILVEGIAEAMLLPILAKIVLADYNAKRGGIKKKLPDTLEDAGVSVINMNGIYFEHFMQLFCNVDRTDSTDNKIPIYCSGITDNDPSEEMPTEHIDGNNPALKLIENINKSEYVKLYPNNLKTFEYDLAMKNGNLNIMLRTISELWPRSGGDYRREIDSLKKTNWSTEKNKTKRAKAAFKLLNLIEKSEIGKGLFAQVLADKLQNCEDGFAIPQYIKKAVIWACGGNINDD